MEQREGLLNEIADATDRLAAALAAFGDAYERADDDTADRLEEQLFRPVQLAYGRAKRTYAGFAERHGLAARAFAPAAGAGPGRGVHDLVEDAVEAVADAEQILSELQDSMIPVEFGDTELRAGLAEVRRLLGEVDGRSVEFLRSLGR